MFSFRFLGGLGELSTDKTMCFSSRILVFSPYPTLPRTHFVCFSAIYIYIYIYIFFFFLAFFQHFSGAFFGHQVFFGLSSNWKYTFFYPHIIIVRLSHITRKTLFGLSAESFYAHARLLSDAACLILWLKFPVVLCERTAKVLVRL